MLLPNAWISCINITYKELKIYFLVLPQASDVTSVESAPSTWNILRDDFMMGAKMRDWNRDEEQKQKEGEDENLTNVSEESESDDESHLEED